MLKDETREETTYLKRLPVRKSSGRILYIKVEHIHWIETADQYVRIHTVSGRHLARESLTRLEKLLDPEMFVRIHRCLMVNIDRVSELIKEDATFLWVVLDDGERLRASRSRWESLQESLMGRIPCLI